MLKALFGGRHQQEETAEHDGAAKDNFASAPTLPSPRRAADQGSNILLSLPLTVTLREVSGSLDRALARGSLRIYASPAAAASPTTLRTNGRGSGHGALGSLRVGGTEVPLGCITNSPKASQVATTSPSLCHRVDSRTLKLTLGSEYDNNGGSSPAFPSSSSSSLLLVFPREATDHDVTRTIAVLSNLATGRGQPSVEEPAGAAGYGPRPHPLPHQAAAAGSCTGAGISDESLVLFRDADLAWSLGWKDNQPVRLVHLERIPTTRGARTLGEAMAAAGGPGTGSGGGDDGDGGGRHLLGPTGAEIGSPGGTREGRLRGLGLGGLWGSVAVANLAYEKDVRVRYSLDGWASYGEVSANWDKRMGLGADNFNFYIDLDRAAADNGVSLRTTLAAGNHVTLSLAVHYLVSGQDHWDNNEGANYTFDLPCE